jgi:hypothetical protein
MRSWYENALTGLVQEKPPEYMYEDYFIKIKPQLLRCAEIIDAYIKALPEVDKPQYFRDGLLDYVRQSIKILEDLIQQKPLPQESTGELKQSYDKPDGGLKPR